MAKKKDLQITGDKSLTRKEVDRIKAPLELDLIAFYKIVEDEVFKTLSEGIKDGKTPDQIINDVGELL